jgi:hypothetical protein
MAIPTLFYVDPRTLHLPTSRPDGADPVKLQRPIARYGTSLEGMPPPFVNRGSDGAMMFSDGVTQATRAAKLRPGTKIEVELIGECRPPVLLCRLLENDCGACPLLGPSPRPPGHGVGYEEHGARGQ